MVKTNKSFEETVREAFNALESSLKDLTRKVDYANMKLDHVIETNRSDRYATAYAWAHDSSEEYRYE